MSSDYVEKHYICVSGEGANFLRVEVYYEIGGMNYFTGKERERGYYLMVVPVKRERGFESFTAFTGFTQMLFPVKRKSDNGAQKALDKAREFEDRVIEQVCAKNNLKVVSFAELKGNK